MTRRARFRPAARRDLKRLAAFLADAPPAVAEEMVRRLEARVERLTRFPFMGRPLKHGELREAIVPYGKSRYVIRYKVTETTIQIVRIWHGRENRPG